MKSHTCLLVLLITLSTVSSFRIFPVAAKAPFYVVVSEDADNEEFGATGASVAETSTILIEESSATEDSTELEESSTPTVTPTNAAETTVPDEIFTNPPVRLIGDSTKSDEINQDISTKESTTIAIETTTEGLEVTTVAPEIVTKAVVVTTAVPEIVTKAVVITTAVPETVTKEAQTTASLTKATSQTSIATSTEVSSEEVSTTSQSEAITIQPVPELDISTNLLPPKTEFRKFDFDPRYDDWKKVPVSYEEILIPRS